MLKKTYLEFKYRFLLTLTRGLRIGHNCCPAGAIKEPQIDLQVFNKQLICLSAISQTAYINDPASLLTLLAGTTIFQRTQSTPSKVDFVAWAGVLSPQHVSIKIDRCRFIRPGVNLARYIAANLYLREQTFLHTVGKVGEQSRERQESIRYRYSIQYRSIDT